VKRWPFLVLLVASCVAVYFLQRSHAQAPITPRPLLYIVADTQRESERLPLLVTRISGQEEISIGDQLARQYVLRTTADNDPEMARISAYLNTVGDFVAKQVRRKDIPYHFYLSNDRNLVNAFALPGGHIVVGRGLLELIESEDELAALLGHEITHVDNRHAVEHLQYEAASRKLGLGDVYQLGRPAVELFEAGYTKEQELEADRNGLDLAVAAGYSPAGAINLMKRFQQLEPVQNPKAASPLEEFAEVPFTALVEYFQSHPPASERLTALQKEILEQHLDASKPERTFTIQVIFLTDAAERLNRTGNFQKSIARFQEATHLDGSYLRAWRGLSQAAWRSGDADEAARAAIEVIHHDANPRDWKLAARAMAASNAESSLSNVEKLESETYPSPDPSNEAYFAARLEVAGIAFQQSKKDALPEFRKLLSDTPLANSARAFALREIAWWMYREGKLDLAVQQLEDARQLMPQSRETTLQLVWVLTDLGRQADAQQFQLDVGGGFPSQEDGAEWRAASAVLDWRTDNHEAAERQFEIAAAGDPVWMHSQWVENNYSASAAGVIKQLEMIESARRLSETQNRGFR